MVDRDSCVTINFNNYCYEKMVEWLCKEKWDSGFVNGFIGHFHSLITIHRGIIGNSHSLQFTTQALNLRSLLS
jgi:hypothetical protein